MQQARRCEGKTQACMCHASAASESAAQGDAGQGNGPVGSCSAPVVEFSLHQPGADVGVGCQPQGVKSTVSSCMQLEHAIRLGIITSSQYTLYRGIQSRKRQ